MPGRDIAQIRAVASLLRMSPIQRRKFGRFVENSKVDKQQHYSFEDLLQLGHEFLAEEGR
jgi:hypothetical protein